MAPDDDGDQDPAPADLEAKLAAAEARLAAARDRLEAVEPLTTEELDFMLDGDVDPAVRDYVANSDWAFGDVGEVMATEIESDDP